MEQKGKGSVQWSTAHLTADQRAAIGSVAVESTYCEQWVESLIWATLDVDETKGKFVTFRMPMSARIELLANLADPHLTVSERAVFAKLVTRLKETNERRNHVVHGDWRGGRPNALIALVLGPDPKSPASATKRRLNTPPATMKATEIADVAQALADVTGDLMRFARTWKYLSQLLSK